MKPLKTLREEGARQFAALPLPASEETWRRTPLDRFQIESYTPLPGKTNGAAKGEASQNLPVPIALQGELLYGEKTSPATLDPVLQKRGVVLTTLADAAAKNHPAFQNYFDKSLQNRKEKIFSQNEAHWQTGAFCFIPKNVVVEKPLLLSSSFSQPESALFPRVLIVLEKGAQATLIHHATSRGETGKNFSNTVFEIYLEENATLNFIDIQNLSDVTYSLELKRAELAADATLMWTLDIQGSRAAKTNLETILKGRGANAKIRGLMNGKKKQQLEIYSYTQHVAPNTTANILVKGTATDRAKTIFQGMIRIEKEAQQTESYMTNNNLILSDKAHCESIPRLEIEADDVRASHGATVGEVDAEQLFYLQTRGLPRKEAEQLLTRGFCEDVFCDLGSEELRTLLRHTAQSGTE